MRVADPSRAAETLGRLHMGPFADGVGAAAERQQYRPCYTDTERMVEEAEWNKMQWYKCRISRCALLVLTCWLRK
jgi:hypothetical protein